MSPYRIIGIYSFLFPSLIETFPLWNYFHPIPIQLALQNVCFFFFSSVCEFFMCRVIQHIFWTIVYRFGRLITYLWVEHKCINVMFAIKFSWTHHLLSIKHRIYCTKTVFFSLFFYIHFFFWCRNALCYSYIDIPTQNRKCFFFLHTNNLLNVQSQGVYEKKTYYYKTDVNWK